MRDNNPTTDYEPQSSDPSTLVIHTPEGISFCLIPASPALRFFAWFIDLACIMVFTSALSFLLSSFGVVLGDILAGVLIVIYFSISIGYGILLEWLWRGQTLGKRLLKLRVVDEQGLRLQFSQIAIRNLLRFVDAIPLFYLVGGIACLISRHAQRLGDYAANTIVIRNPPSAVPDLDLIAAGKFNSFRAFSHLEARLRQRATAHEAALALNALLRREQLEAVARVKLFKEFADHFRALVAFPEEATFGLTDEQYVRNTVDSLLRTSHETPENMDIS